MNIESAMSDFIEVLLNKLTNFRVKYGKEPKFILINPTTSFMLKYHFESITYTPKEYEIKTPKSDFTFNGVDLIPAAFIEVGKFEIVGDEDIEMSRLYNNQEGV